MLNKGYKWAIVHTDEPNVVQALIYNGLKNLGIIVLKKAQRVMRSKGQWWIRYMLRECNIIVNQLAKLSLAWMSSLQVFDVALNEVLEVL